MPDAYNSDVQILNQMPSANLESFRKKRFKFLVQVSNHISDLAALKLKLNSKISCKSYSFPFVHHVFYRQMHLHKHHIAKLC